MIPLNIEALVRVFEPDVAIQAVYLFGSHATGKAAERSDIDLGIVCEKDSISAEAKLNLLKELARAGFDRVDLVIVDQSDLVLAHEVVKYHKVIFCRADFDHPTFCSKVTRQYLDFQPTLAMQVQALKAKLSSGV